MSPEQSAKAYYDCMRDDGIDVELHYNDRGELAIVDFSEDHSYVMSDGKGHIISQSAPNHLLSQQTIDDVANDTSGTVALFIDGIDHSEAYAQCLATSGYNSLPSNVTITKPDAADIALQVQGNNVWAACARENGWPNLKDSVMPTTTEIDSLPSILLPSTMTEGQLRQLLTACPNFNPEKQEELISWRQSNPNDFYPDGFLPDPSITFESESTESTSAPSVTPEDQAHLDRLNEILYEQSNAYWTERALQTSQ